MNPLLLKRFWQRVSVTDRCWDWLAGCCVNPSHLFLGTAKENMQDCKRKGRHSKPPSALGKGKLTEQDVRRIRELSPGVSQKALAEQFGVTQTNINYIVRRATWRHVA